MRKTFAYKIETTKTSLQMTSQELIQEGVAVKYVTNPARTAALSLGLGDRPVKKRNNAATITFLGKTEFIVTIVESHGSMSVIMDVLSFFQRFLQANADQELPACLPEWQEFMTNLVVRMNEEFISNSTYMSSRLSLSTCYLKKHSLLWASLGKNHVFHFDLTRTRLDPFKAQVNYPKSWILPSDLTPSNVKEHVEHGQIPVVSRQAVIMATEGLISIKGGIEIIRSQDLFQIIRHERTALSAAHAIVKNIKEKRKGTESFSFLVVKT